MDEQHLAEMAIVHERRLRRAWVLTPEKRLELADQLTQFAMRQLSKIQSPSPRTLSDSIATAETAARAISKASTTKGEGLSSLQQIVEVLQKHGLRFVIIGGHAVNFPGFIRATEDVDVLLCTDMLACVGCDY